MHRRTFQRDGLTLSYLDSDNGGHALIALHAHWMEGQTYAPLADALAPEWRVIALDQRGHGHSDHARTYTREDYLDDLLGLFEHLQLADAVLLGNSLGGANAYQFAARHPERVRALIIEDIGATVQSDISFTVNWAGTSRSKKELEERIGPRLLPYLQDSIRQAPEGWRLAFDAEDMLSSQRGLNGDHWQDWLATDCPALLIGGDESRVTSRTQLEEMATRRPNTQLVVLKGGHVVHFDNPDGFTSAVKPFLWRTMTQRS